MRTVLLVAASLGAGVVGLLLSALVLTGLLMLARTLSTLL